MSTQDLSALGQSSTLSCGNCRYSKRRQDDLTMIECHGAPPAPIVLPAPNGIQVQFVWPTLRAVEAACALHKPKLELVIGGRTYGASSHDPPRTTPNRRDVCAESAAPLPSGATRARPTSHERAGGASPMTPLERVARALCVAIGCAWDEQDENDREVLMDEARAVIASLREPTEQMTDAVAEHYIGFRYSQETKRDWQTMIDKVLEG